MKNEDRIIKKLVDIKAYLKDEVATKAELRATEDRLISHIDGFVKKHETLEDEVAALGQSTDRRLTRVEGHLGIADS